MKGGRILIVEDSPTISRFLCDLVEEAGYEVVGVADNGILGEELVLEHKPGLVLSDIRMPGGDGIEMTRRIMHTHPAPVVLITAYDPTNPDLVFRAMQAGALEVLPKPPARNDPGFEKYVQLFRRTLRILYGMPVVRRFQPTSSGAIEIPEAIRAMGQKSAKPLEAPLPIAGGDQRPVIAIGASTGGPTIVATLVQALERGGFHFVVIAQHIVPDFLPSFRDWLQSMVPHPVRLAQEGETPQQGAIYLAAPSSHLVLDRSTRWKLLSPQSVVSAHVPSIDLLFESLATLQHSRTAILLTGMGQDGAAGLRLLKESGAFTIVQDPATAVVTSMPEAALRLGAASEVLSPSKIARWLRRLSEPPAV